MDRHVLGVVDHHHMTINTAQPETLFAITAPSEVTTKQCANHQRKLEKFTKRPEQYNDSEAFLGTVGTENSNPWIVMNKVVDFHVNTRAEMSVIPDQAYRKLESPTLTSPNHSKKT